MCTNSLYRRKRVSVVIEGEKFTRDFYVTFFSRSLAESDRDYAANADGTVDTVELSDV